MEDVHEEVWYGKNIFDKMHKFFTKTAANE